ncbi:hypothetical protein GGR33_003639 [Methylobacterium brachythecii]|uniref:Uncharacterized protein n=1 Tax=Methylobacterium brachythecii TaxID=1176177 RepID=A0A7W6AN60_9HYPH|nr:hypothetical protein [Methylobacterium brachythecii]
MNVVRSGARYCLPPRPHRAAGARLPGRGERPRHSPIRPRSDRLRLARTRAETRSGPRGRPEQLRSLGRCGMHPLRCRHPGTAGRTGSVVHAFQGAVPPCPCGSRSSSRAGPLRGTFPGCGAATAGRGGRAIRRTGRRRGGGGEDRARRDATPSARGRGIRSDGISSPSPRPATDGGVRRECRGISLEGRRAAVGAGFAPRFRPCPMVRRPGTVPGRSRWYGCLLLGARGLR